MMKHKILKATLMFLMTLSIVGCNGEGGETPVTPPDDSSEERVSFHYQRKDSNYTGWNLWIWEENHDGKAYEFNGEDEYGVSATYPTSTWTDLTANRLGFIVRKGEWESKDPDMDRYVDFSKLSKDEHNIYHVYLKTEDSGIYVDKEGNMFAEINYATFTSLTRFACLANVQIASYYVTCGDTKILEVADAGNRKRIDVDLPSDHKFDFSNNYKITLKTVSGIELTSEVAKSMIFETEEFEEMYNYDGELGAIYQKDKTTFKVWSPSANSITLKLYESGSTFKLGGTDEAYNEVEMTRLDKGVFSCEVRGDLEGKYYTYFVKNGAHPKGIEIVDPYARSCGVNGVRGMIVDFSKTNPEGWDDVNYFDYDRKALTVYETHVADVTSSETWTGTEANRKLFKGMYEEGTTYTEDGVTVKTGFDHIKELGVNAVQLIPIFDQANDEINMKFNWGYNPLNYNSLEGGYSTDPRDGYVRIREFKELVQAYNKAGISIIMDVVYNHVNGAINSNFDVLMPGYYFRYNSNGSLANGSGCGNETASDHYMMRKFMIDSTKFWTKEYKLGGFRFDLMGLHDLETMKQLTAEVKKINPHSVIFGEPWTGGATPLDVGKQAKQSNGSHFEGYGAFNDHIRDGLIKGGLSGDKDLGWVTDATNKPAADITNALIKGIKGTNTYVDDPDKNVTYVTCHDNYTLFDRIAATGKFNKTDDYDTIKKAALLANGVIFTSQGTAFMLAGEEFLRTKNGDKNSYTSSYKVNELDYSLKVKNFDLFENYQKLISLKQNLDGLHLNKEGIKGLDVKFSSDGSTISYTLNDTANGLTYKVYHVNGLGTEETVNLEGYNLYLSTTNSAKELSSATSLDKYETLIAYK